MHLCDRSIGCDVEEQQERESHPQQSAQLEMSSLSSFQITPQGNKLER